MIVMHHDPVADSRDMRRYSRTDGCHDPGGLVPSYYARLHRTVGIVRSAIGMQIAPAHPRRFDLDDDLGMLRRRIRNVDEGRTPIP
jgi:hypothetical protein